MSNLERVPVIVCVTSMKGDLFLFMTCDRCAVVGRNV